jgi:hypothetical protein
MHCRVVAGRREACFFAQRRARLERLTFVPSTALRLERKVRHNWRGQGWGVPVGRGNPSKSECLGGGPSTIGVVDGPFLASATCHKTETGRRTSHSNRRPAFSRGGRRRRPVLAHLVFWLAGHHGGGRTRRLSGPFRGLSRRSVIQRQCFNCRLAGNGSPSIGRL